MLTPPSEVTDAVVARAVEQRWGLVAAELRFEPVGFGSHHWTFEAAGSRWFVTVDDLGAGSADAAGRLAELRDAGATAAVLAARGASFVAAPVPSVSGGVVESLGPHHGISVRPYVDGVAGEWGRYDDSIAIRSVADVLAQLHRCEVSDAPRCRRVELEVPGRDRLEAALMDLDRPWRDGPHGEPCRRLLLEHAAEVNAALRLHRELVERVAPVEHWVITHGEPHPGNVVMTARGPVLVDWDTVRIAPRERDLWMLVREDPSIGDRYSEVTGVTLDRRSLVLFELGWDLADVALFVDDFRSEHADDADSELAWQSLGEHLDPQRWSQLREIL